ncbi:hypothetical protein [Bradyrhizobium sp.]|uniref:hypothetical protein n=1 Tax=Bradyrhizobium sp. TaxID=376 RepID=UPI003D1188C4
MTLLSLYGIAQKINKILCDAQDDASEFDRNAAESRNSSLMFWQLARPNLDLGLVRLPGKRKNAFVDSTLARTAVRLASRLEQNPGSVLRTG